MKKLFDTINSFNKYIGFNLLGLNGLVFALVLCKIFYFDYYIECIKNNHLSGQGIVGLMIAFYIFIAGTFAVGALGLCVFETTTKYRITNRLLTQNIFILVLKYIGAIFSLIFLSLTVWSVSVLIFAH